MTFSIVAYDPKNKEWGVAVQSKFVAVGVIVPFAQANIGAIATQAYCNTSYGPDGLELLANGISADEVIELLTENDPNKDQRQVGVVDAKGNAASFTGKDCFNWAGHIVGKNYCCQGNILTSGNVIKDMSHAFEHTEGDLVEKLFASLEAAQEAGGDKRGQEAAAILIVKEKGVYDGGTDRYIDIRVDEHPTPIKELKKVFEIYDLCLLTRDDPKDIIKLEGEALAKVLSVLKNDGFYSGKDSQKFTDEMRDALIKWMHTNNFEVKERDDNYLFGSVYRYMTRM
ncbi:MAG: DUF1028 domain-containing protein [Candidatus Heimdallarchaeota archaeon]|nr:DUF1028 domain-containing protein [Candidatus Heimdallarchaeota archaeon]MBY8994839.1 DUF1028 domain-containing protein [Candidatus Heimdallarchaeota archaeon]